MVAILIAALLAGEPPAAANPSPAPRPTLQAQFDAANAAHEAREFEKAVKAYEALETLPTVRRNLTALASIQMRKGANLVALDRLDEAELSLRSGLKGAPADSLQLRMDRHLSMMSLGHIASARLNFAAATDEYKAALALAEEPQAKVGAMLSLARSTMFDPGDEAIRYAESTLELARSQPEISKAALANIQTLYARALLNHGRPSEAYAVLRKAVSDQGGLDYKVNINEVITRSDLAIAAMLAGKKDDARRFLAFTGAGRIAEAPFQRAVSMQPPTCGGPANLRPEDVAVIEFNIKQDGSVGVATPIYASSNGPAALEFARAVSGWSWRPQDVAKIPALFKLVTRVELRCSASVERPAVTQLLTGALVEWLINSRARGFGTGESDASAVGPLKTELERRETIGVAPDILAILNILSSNPVVSEPERYGWVLRARDLANAAGAPLAAVMDLELRLLAMRYPSNRAEAEAQRSHLRALLVRPGATDAPVVANTLKIMIAEPAYRLRASDDAAMLLTEVAEDSRLPSTHPLRVGALVRLAGLRATAGDAAGAAAAYRQTGLSTQQCAMLDAKPAMLKQNVSSSDFPMEALSWGFEGWVRTEYDIMADGKTAGQRVIAAYPPFVFRDAAIQIASNHKFAVSYRPDGGAGCSGTQGNNNFQIPSLR